MSQPLSPSSQVKPENKCPGCLLMKLQGMLLPPEKQGIFKLQAKSAATDQIKLYLALKFNEQEEHLPSGSVKIGLRGGKLTLKLDQGKIYPASPILNGSIALSGQQGRANQEGSDSSYCITVSLSQRKPGATARLDTDKTINRTQQNQSPIPPVSDPGVQENLTWVFVGNNSILKGLLKPTLLAILNVIALPCRVEATFCVSPQDIYVTYTPGLLPQTLSKKKRVIIERAIARRLVKRKWNPYLSRQELRYD